MNNGVARINKMVISVISAVSLLILFAMILNFFKGRAEIYQLIVEVVVLLITIGLSWGLYKKQHDHSLIKYVPMIGFYLIYGFVLYTMTNFTAFAFMFFVVVLFSSYNDKKVTLLACILPTAILFSDIVVSSLTIANFFYEYNEQIILYSVSVIVFMFTVIGSSQLNQKINEEKMIVLQAEQSRKNSMLSGVVNIVNNMKNVSLKSDDVAKFLTQSVKDTYTDTETLRTVMNSTAASSMQTLINSVKDVQNNYLELTDEVNDLAKKFNKIQEFTKTISNIAFQTNMLALNAAVESARAGEVGAGFGVVANEVKQLANSSNTSATDIENVIEELTGDMRRIKNTLISFSAVSEELEQSMTNTQEMYEKIQNSIDSINDNINKINSQTGNINQSNDVMSTTVNTAMKLIE